MLPVAKKDMSVAEFINYIKRLVAHANSGGLEGVYMTDKEAEGFLGAMVIFGVIGALIGVGIQGNLQGAFLGAGIGACVPIFLLMISE